MSYRAINPSPALTYAGLEHVIHLSASRAARARAYRMLEDPEAPLHVLLPDADLRAPFFRRDTPRTPV
jgi:hypothetical protein